MTPSTVRQLVGLGTALAASIVLLVLPPVQRPASAVPLPPSVAWPQARSASLPVTLPDGTAYQPLLFLDARTSLGTAPSPDGRALRLLLRSPDAPLRALRSLPQARQPSFGNPAVAGNTLAWVERTRDEPAQVWSTDVTTGRPAHRLVADAADPLFDDGQRSLRIGAGRLWWITADPGRADATQVRSVALTGGPVQVLTEPGSWGWSQWPWTADGVGSPVGTTSLRDVVTGERLTVRNQPGRSTTRCSPTWCEVVALLPGGASEVRLMRPDGTDRRRIAGDAARPAILEVAPLDRFEVIWQTDPTTDLTQNGQLLVHEIASGRNIQLSLAAATVSYDNGVLWWSNGGRTTTVWHSLDLRTV